MVDSYLQFKASLSGTGPAKYHIAKLKNNALFDIEVDNESEIFIAKVIGPKNIHPESDFTKLHDRFSQRAEDIEINVPEIVNKTAKDIHSVGMAEQKILLSKILLNFAVNDKPKADVTLCVLDEENPIVKEFLRYFAFWRISFLAQVLDMKIEGKIKESILEL